MIRYLTVSEILGIASGAIARENLTQWLQNNIQETNNS